MYRTILLLFCVFVGVQSSLFPGSNIEPCRKEDTSCITSTTDYLLKATIDGYSPWKVESLDPMSQDYVEGIFVIVKFHLYNSTVAGLKSCRVVNAKFIKDQDKINFKIVCPHLYMYGIYDISGKLIIVPIEGNGNYRIDAMDYHITVEVGTNVIETDDGNKHLKFVNLKVFAEVRRGMVMELTNLFNGQHKELADAALKFGNAQWRAVSKEFQGPIIYKNVKKVINNMNKYLKNVPLEKLIVNY